MKKFLLVASIAAVGAAAPGASSAMASPTGNTAGNTLDVQEVRDRTLLHARAAETLFKSVRGAYAMDDGTTLHLYRSSSGYVALVSGQKPVDVMVTRSGKFVAPDGVIELRFVKNSGGLYDGVVLSTLKEGGASVASARRLNEG